MKLIHRIISFTFRPFNKDHIKSGRFHQTLQRDSILGRDGSRIDIEPQQASVVTEKVYKTRSLVSSAALIWLTKKVSNQFAPFSCKEYQNLNAFFAIVMGMSNSAVSRLTQTWDKLPSKFRKLFTEFEALIDPSRNHRAYR